MSDLFTIEVKNIKKSFKIYMDKGNTLKERSLFRKRRRYETREVLKGLSFNVKKGETLALIGHNGCGKSTTLKLLTRIMYPDSGEIIMRGRVSSLIELGAGFHPDMSGRENIYINASIFGLTKKEIDDRVNEIIEFSELEEFIDNPVRTYSSGMYTRLAFAVAINVNADILLVDEILSVGDENFQAKCYNKMRDLKASGMTIVLVTHSIGTVKSFCDTAIWINDGQIAAQGRAYDVAETYLEYMNRKRIAEFNKKAKEEGLEVKARIDEPITMDKSAKHYGNRKAIITDCQVLDDLGQPTHSILSTDKFRLKIDFEVKDKELEEIVVGIGVYTLDRVWIFGVNTELKDMVVDCREKKKGTAYFDCEPLRLTTDLYILQCSIQDKHGEPCDFYNEYSRFNVLDESNTAGYLNYECEWKVEMKS